MISIFFFEKISIITVCILNVSTLFKELSISLFLFIGYLYSFLFSFILLYKSSCYHNMILSKVCCVELYEYTVFLRLG